jgi:hypothetical protein
MAIRLARDFESSVPKNVPCTMLARPQDVLPTTLAADESSGGLGVNMTFERVTPKQLPAPSPYRSKNND